MTTVRKRVLTALLASAAAMLIAASASRVDLSPHEEALLSQIGFDREVALVVKEESQCPLHRLSGYDESGYQIMVNGFVVSVPQHRSEQTLFALRKRLGPKSYQAFIVDINDGIKADKLAVIKGSDPYDILRIMRTNGEGEDISHEDVIEKLKEWGKCWPFDIIGAENDWVEIEFRVLPKDVHAFAEDVYDFAPSVVDEDAGTTLELARDLKATKRLYLWWE